jgi:hypothetical protein
MEKMAALSVCDKKRRVLIRNTILLWDSKLLPTFSLFNVKNPSVSTMLEVFSEKQKNKTCENMKKLNTLFGCKSEHDKWNRIG